MAKNAPDATLATEADVRVQAIAKGQELMNTVAYIRGTFTKLDSAEALLDTAIERTGKTGTTIAQLNEDRDAAVRACTAAECERTSYRNCVHGTNQDLVTACQAATQADSRPIQARTAV